MPQCNCSLGVSPGSTGVSIENIYILKTIEFDESSNETLTSKPLQHIINKTVCSGGTKKECSQFGNSCRKICPKGFGKFCKSACKSVCTASRDVCQGWSTVVAKVENFSITHSVSAKGKIFFYLDTDISESIDVKGTVELSAGATIGMGILVEAIETKTEIKESNTKSRNFLSKIKGGKISESVDVRFENKGKETFYTELTLKESVKVEDFNIGDLEFDGSISACIPFNNIFNETIPKSGIDVSVDNCVLTLCANTTDKELIANISISASASKKIKKFGTAKVSGSFGMGVPVPITA